MSVPEMLNVALDERRQEKKLVIYNKNRTTSGIDVWKYYITTYQDIFRGHDHIAGEKLNISVVRARNRNANSSPKILMSIHFNIMIIPSYAPDPILAKVYHL